MEAYKQAWTEFSDTYYFYRADAANWQDYFDRIDQAVGAAGALVAQAKQTGNTDLLPLAHEELEAARMTMLELRPLNGFSKFITDKMTIYHEPMEHIVPTHLEGALENKPTLVGSLRCLLLG